MLKSVSIGVSIKKTAFEGQFFCGADETRTRGLLRDRQAL